MTKFEKIVLVASILSVLVIISIILFSYGDNKHYTDEEKVLYNQFVVTEKRMQSGSPMYIMYDKDSKVMYYGYPRYEGWMVPIYNSDGSVKIYTK